MSEFPLMVPLSGGELDRADPIRRDPEAVAALLESAAARMLPLWNGKPAILLTEGAPPTLAWRRISPEQRAVDPDPIFLGLDQRIGAEAARFAIDVSSLEEEDALALFQAPVEGGGVVKFIDLRSIAPELTPAEAGALCGARSLLEWRRTHRFCAVCGHATAQAQGGWRRDCPACGAHHFPRTDPVVIMLVLGRDPATGEERVAMGRQPNWPPGLYSLLAGYVEPGEDLEAAVRRETMEEAGLKVGRVGYLASQPWPFPSTLMIGMWAEALSETITRDAHELEDCRWFSREEVADALAGRHPTVTAPRLGAIARVLTQAWVERLLPEDRG